MSTTLTIRNLAEPVKQKLQMQAASHGRSMEAEARAILSDAVDDQEFGAAWIEMSTKLRGEAIPLQTRSAPRELDLS